MKTCQNCGAVLNDDIAFCVKCGARLEEQEAAQTGAEAPAGAETQSAGEAQNEAGTAFEAAANEGNEMPDAPANNEPVGQEDSQIEATQTNGDAGQNQYSAGADQNGGAYQQNGPDQNAGGPQYNNGPNGYSGDFRPILNTMGLAPRNIALCIVLAIVTCGIYGIYWMIKLNDEINQIVGDRGATTGGMVFLFSLITCGIYGFYWEYKMGEKVDYIKGDRNGSTPILYLVLGLVGFGIIDYALMQDTINKTVVAPMQ